MLDQQVIGSKSVLSATIAAQVIAPTCFHNMKFSPAPRWVNRMSIVEVKKIAVYQAKRDFHEEFLACCGVDAFENYVLGSGGVYTLESEVETLKEGGECEGAFNLTSFITEQAHDYFYGPDGEDAFGIPLQGYVSKYLEYACDELNQAYESRIFYMAKEQGLEIRSDEHIADYLRDAEVDNMICKEVYAICRELFNSDGQLYIEEFMAQVMNDLKHELAVAA